MKRLLYIAPTEFYNESDGVTKKIKQQIIAFSHNGYEVDVASYNKNNIIICDYQLGLFNIKKNYKSSRTRRRTDLFLQSLNWVAKSSYDVCYIRYPYASFALLKTVRKFKAYGINNILEIPSYPIPHPLKKGIKSLPNRLLFIEEKLCVNRMKKYINQVYSIGEPAQTIFGIKNVSIPNGINVSDFRPKNCIKNDEQIHILFCGSMFDYQGVDRLIRGIYDYNKTKKNKTIIAEIVGDGPKLSEWMALTSSLNLHDCVRFHGYLSGKELEDIVDQCDIACSLLAAHRKDIRYASPLKTKEYMARGIPFIYSYHEIGMDNNVPFAIRIQSDETPIDISAIVIFCETYADKQQEMVDAMRQYASSCFSWENILKRI